MEGEDRSRSLDIYAVGVLLYQLFTGCLPRRRNETGFVIRKAFAKLPTDIQDLITKMLSTIPANRSQDILQQALELFDSQLSKRQQLSFTERPARVKNRVADRRKEDQSKPARLCKVTKIDTVTDAVKQMPHSPEDSEAISQLATRKKLPTSGNRVNVLFALLCLVYAQYLFLFDGQENINQSMPAVYVAVVSEFEGLVGKPDVRGTFPGENSRLY